MVLTAQTQPVKWSILAWFYLVCAIAGAIIPWYYNLVQVLNGPEEFSMTNYFKGGFANNFAASITTDFFIGTTPVLVWMIVEGKKLKMKGVWWYVPFSFIISFAFTCPLFLFNRQRKLDRRRASAMKS